MESDAAIAASAFIWVLWSRYQQPMKVFPVSLNAECPLHINKTGLLLSVARLNHVLFGSVVVCSQAALFPVVEFFFSDQNACLGWVLSDSSADWIRSSYCLVFLPWTVHLAVYSSELKAGKHFQIELHGCNQCSGDRWRAWTRPVREQRDLRWCPRGQTHDSQKRPCDAPVPDYTNAKLKLVAFSLQVFLSCCWFYLICDVWGKWHHAVMSWRTASGQVFHLNLHRRCSPSAGLGSNWRGDVTAQGFSMN